MSPPSEGFFPLVYDELRTLARAYLQNGQPSKAAGLFRSYLLARPGDDVTPADFVAFHCDGSFGIHIDPGVWHQPVFPVGESARFDDKQGRVHACIAMDFVSEFGCYLEVPLRRK